MRPSLIVLAAAVAVPLGAYQAVASLALADRAQTGSWPALLRGPLGPLVDHVPASAPLPPALRLVLAQRAVRAGDLSRAGSFEDTLPPGDDRTVLAGDVARARGDFAGAARDYIVAGDLEDVAAIGTTLAGAGRVDDAVALERAVIERLATRGEAGDTLADAYYQLAGLEELDAYRHGQNDPRRLTREHDALADYQRAVTTSPLALRYAIALGNQYLNLGDLASAREVFAGARVLDASSAEPLVGLGDAALRAGDRTSARTFLESAQAIAPDDAAVHRLADALK